MNLDDFYFFHDKANTGSAFKFKYMSKQNKKEIIRNTLIGKKIHTIFMLSNINYILITLFIIIFSYDNPFITQNKFANITLKIKGKGKYFWSRLYNQFLSKFNYYK